ncbi:uncharacterized protein LOC116340587 [Contarinia nasturtii]|uniref:uncharacterized protein LOC116340587 n=1 Tax=Contarinia nasturtii TaxID=265458 RepID=UPI0012D44C1B|nr:uncharacterized protein LOC116340587 [Contarinia nasturtii]
MEQDIFRQIQFNLGTDLPKCVVDILKALEFTNVVALKEINSETVKQIEEFCNENPEVLGHSLIGTVYEKVKPFKFLLGHRLVILQLPNYCKSIENNRSNDDLLTDSTIMRALKENARINLNRPESGKRYNTTSKTYAIYLYLMGGKALYESICANLPLPKADTVLKYVEKNKQKICEGELRCTGLVEYLENFNLKKVVWVSEDGTGINTKIEYDNSTNQIVGLVLPINGTNGMPVSYTFLANSVDDIQKYIKKPVSTLLYAVLAQPLQPNIPPYVLQIFGTDNTFEAKDVVRRWAHITEELRKHGIEVAGFSSDGDTKLFSAMLHYSNPCLKNVCDHFTQVNDPLRHTIAYMQDTIHTVLKMRNRFLSPGIILPMGTKVVSVSHLKMLINKVGKGVHGLVMKDICGDDRQNYNALKQIMKPEVTEALAEHIIDSEATIMYIKICHEISSALYEEGHLPLQRVYLIWHATFFLRAWKKWIQNSRSSIAKKGEYYTVGDNFLTRNCYGCIEINANNLISLMQTFRDRNMDELFLVTLFNSQPCEEFFRQLRSMGTINFTKVNFTLLEVLHLISRVELLNECIYIKLKDMGVSFPRNKISNSGLNKFPLPSDVEIKTSIDNAQRDALLDAARFGMKIDPCDVQTCNLDDIDVFLKKPKRKHNETDGDDEDQTFKMLSECPNIRSYSPEKYQSKAPFIEITTDKGTKKTIRKSTLVWMLSEAKGKLSKDRLQRVQDVDNPKKVRRSLKFDPELSVEKTLKKKKELQVGDWCIFHEQENNNHQKNIYVGNVLSFKYIEGKTAKQKQYTWDFAPVSPPEGENDTKKGIQVLASWYKMTASTKLEPIAVVNNFYLNIENYIATLSRQPFQSTDLKIIDEEFFAVIKAELLKLCEISQ